MQKPKLPSRRHIAESGKTRGNFIRYEDLSLGDLHEAQLTMAENIVLAYVTKSLAEVHGNLELELK